MQRASICPQRVLAEAVRLLEMLDLVYRMDEADKEAWDNTLTELDDLSKRLHAAGINKI